ncbi:MAG: T9SS type A sorting domain-containing protein [Bacteroidota bacterium]
MKTNWTLLLLLALPSWLLSQPLISFNIDLEIDLINYTAVNYNALERPSGNILFNTTDGNQLLLGELSPQGEPIWAKLWSADNLGQNIRPNEIRLLDDGGFVVAGSGVTPISGPVGNSILLRFDQDGNLNWGRSYGRGTELNTTVEPLANGDFLLATTTASQVVGNSNTDVLLMRISSEGELIWAKSYGAENFDRAYSALELENGDILVAGVYTSAPDYLLMRLNPEGNLTWAKSYPLTPNNSDPDQMIRLSNGNLLLRGFNNDTFNSAIFCVDDNGDVIWAQETSDPGSGVFLRTTPHPEEGFYTYGFDFQEMPNGIFETFAYFNNDGTLNWSVFTEIQQTQPADMEVMDNGHLLFLSDLSVPNRLVFRRRLGTSADCEGKLGDNELEMQMVEIEPTSRLLTTMEGGIQGSLAISSIDLDLEVDVLCIDLTGTEELSNAPIRVFPNPVVDELQVQWPTSFQRDDAWIQLINGQGQLMEWFRLSPGQEYLAITMSSYAPGPYFLLFSNGTTRQFVKQ